MNATQPRFPRIWRCAGVMCGEPCLRATRIPAAIIADRFAAGDSISLLADDYGVPVASVIDALRLVIIVKGSSLSARSVIARWTRLIPETHRP
jgi:uncharacterized protein (DUF433 family)